MNQRGDHGQRQSYDDHPPSQALPGAGGAVVRAATDADLDAVAAIYAHEVATGTATGRRSLALPACFAIDLMPPPRAKWEDMLASTHPGDHFLVATLLGRLLYDDLLARMAAGGVRTALACIALPNDASEALHRACGFERQGVLREVGHKLDRWIDVAWWQRMLVPDVGAWPVDDTR